MNFAEYLIEQSWATAEQIDDLRSQANTAGRSLFDQAYLSGLLSEHDLLTAIYLETSLPTVELKGRKINSSILKLLSGKQAWSLKILPFAIVKETNKLLFASKTPGDQSLIKTVSAIFPDHEIKLFSAVGPILDAAIIEYYRFEPPMESSSETASSISGNTDKPETQAKVAFLIGSHAESDRYLGQALVADGYHVIMADDWSDLTEELENCPPDLILIRESTDTVPPELPASTVIRRYGSVSSLLDPTQDQIEYNSLAMTNLRLATETLKRTLNDFDEMPVLIAPMVEKLCKLISLTSRDNLITVTAGYLQDLSALYFREEGPHDRKTSHFMLQGLIDQSGAYPPGVMSTLRNMYTDLTSLSPDNIIPKEIRNGSILTIIDFYMRQFPDQSRITPCRFDLIDRKIREQVGKLFFPEIADLFLDLIRSEVTRPGSSESTGHALVLDQSGLLDKGLSEIISESNYSLNTTSSIEQFIMLYSRKRPDLIVITGGKDAIMIESTVQKLVSDGVVFDLTPSFFLHTSTEFDRIARLVTYGFGHTIHYNGEFDIFAFRLKQIADNKEKESRIRLQVLQEIGTHGSLDDMNLIDLLQSMGPSNKMLCISVSGRGHSLTMYLTQGQLVHAASDDLEGVEAVYEALKWDSGVWSVDQVSPKEIPEQNVHRSIDSILMEGCYLLDEMNRERPTPQEITTDK